MAKYMEKPVFVEAIQFDGNNLDEVWKTLGSDDIYGPDKDNPDVLIVTTLVGDRNVRVDNWIVRNLRGELKVIDPKIFANRYEFVEE